MPAGIYKRTKENSGKTKGMHWKLSDETCKKFSEIAKEKGFGKWMFGRKNHMSKKAKEKKSIEMIGNKFALGNKLSMEVRKKMSNSHIKDRHWNWQGGVTSINETFRKSFEYKQWRSDVFQRDEWTCQTCGKKGRKLHAHHIKEFSNYPELRLVLDNGITLCKECHLLTDNYGNKKTSEQLQQENVVAEQTKLDAQPLPVDKISPA